MARCIGGRVPPESLMISFRKRSFLREESEALKAYVFIYIYNILLYIIIFIIIYIIIYYNNYLFNYK